LLDRKIYVYFYCPEYGLGGAILWQHGTPTGNQLEASMKPSASTNKVKQHDALCLPSTIC
jgi:hypothetical protein